MPAPLRHPRRLQRRANRPFGAPNPPPKGTRTASRGGASARKWRILRLPRHPARPATQKLASMPHAATLHAPTGAHRPIPRSTPRPTNSKKAPSPSRYRPTCRFRPKPARCPPADTARLPKARNGLGLACEMTAGAMAKKGAEFPVPGVSAADLSAAGVHAEAFELAIDAVPTAESTPLPAGIAQPAPRQRPAPRTGSLQRPLHLPLACDRGKKDRNAPPIAPPRLPCHAWTAAQRAA